MHDNVSAERQFVPQPTTAFAAWQLILGHLSRHVCPDARLVILISSVDNRLKYASRTFLGEVIEESHSLESLCDSLANLWRTLEHYHSHLFDFVTHAPIDYEAVNCFEPKTQDGINRLVETTRAVFTSDWSILMMYHSVDVPEIRVKMRLIALEDSIQISSQAPSVFQSARKLFHNASTVFVGEYSRT